MSIFTGSPLTGAINGTNQADIFSGEVTGSAIAYGALNAQINAGNGIDTITLMGKASASEGGTGIGYGAYKSTINGGNGDDTINISGSVAQTFREFDISATADAYVRTDLDLRRNDNYGKNQYLLIGTSRGGGGIPYGGPDAMRSLIQFDLSSLTRPVNSAFLELTVFGNNSTNGVYTVDVNKIKAPWIEGNGYEGPNSGVIGAPPGAVFTDEAFGVAWAGAGDNSDPDAANNQTQPPFDPNPSASVTINSSISKLGDTVRWDITNLVNDWVNGKDPNFGLILRDPTSDGSFRELSFGSREGDFWNFPGTSPSPVRGPRLHVFVTVGEGIGVYQSSVYGGNGNDTINISGTNFGIKDSLISGGNGDDTFNVGTGQGTIDGGKGIDRLVVDYFNLDANNKPTNVTVTSDASGNVLISSTTDNLGNSFDASGQPNAWTQTIKGLEQFLVKGTAYTASQFVSVFG